MPDRHPVRAAAGLARAAVAGIDPAPSSLGEMARRFAAVAFDVPDDPDADGFLFQWGPASWFTTPTFVLSLVRQLEVADADGEHERYEQVQFEFRYDRDAELDGAGRHTEWWFPAEGRPFEDWLAGVAGAPVMSVVERRSPREFVIYQEQA